MRVVVIDRRAAPFRDSADRDEARSTGATPSHGSGPDEARVAASRLRGDAERAASAWFDRVHGALGGETG
jgi:hypothetical protein